jgi:hypothetical protein
MPRYQGPEYRPSQHMLAQHVGDLSCPHDRTSVCSGARQGNEQWHRHRHFLNTFAHLAWDNLVSHGHYRGSAPPSTEKGTNRS